MRKFLIIAFLLTLLIGLLVFQSKTPQNDNEALNSLCLIQSSAIIGGHPLMLKPLILATIQECESENDPMACNTCEGTEWEGLYNPDICPCGAGPYQIIPSTLKYCEEKLGRELDVFNPVDNEACAIFLYENYGTKPWTQSQACWDK